MESELIALAGKRAENLFENGKHCCSEAVLTVCNQGFGGGVAPELCRPLSAGFCGGMGNGDGVCGALSGAIMALGLFLSPGSRGKLSGKKFRRIVGMFHESFVEKFGSSCCNVLIEDFGRDRKNRRRYCCSLTGAAAEECVRLILDFRPELAGNADREFLERHISKLGGIVKSHFPENQSW
jgi:C_GCAxxG_C_C family probable redox protein